MTRFRSILAAVALATALAPITANATTMTSLDYVHIAAHKAMSGPLPEVQHVAAAAQRSTNQTVVTSGWGHQLYPESIGG